MITYLWIAIGSALGGMARYWCGGLAVAAFGETFPWGTILINISGSFVIGLFAGLTEPGGRIVSSPDLRLFVMTGICGGYTTFSAFSLQTLTLVRNGEPWQACGNVLLSVTLCLIAVWLGFALAMAINQIKTN